ncbi:hypothetical protein ARSEF4850_002827 [Beauveria asiatica]
MHQQRHVLMMGNIALQWHVQDHLVQLLAPLIKGVQLKKAAPQFGCAVQQLPRYTHVDERPAINPGLRPIWVAVPPTTRGFLFSAEPFHACPIRLADTL